MFEISVFRILIVLVRRYLTPCLLKLMLLEGSIGISIRVVGIYIQQGSYNLLENFFSFFFFKGLFIYYLFIYLFNLFLVASGLSCGMRDLRCGAWASL